jgi:hypothetical protein
VYDRRSNEGGREVYMGIDKHQGIVRAEVGYSDRAALKGRMPQEEHAVCSVWCLRRVGFFI